jgi:thiosulfate/3-mercaptopyruvate sulfurtransferase
MNRDSIIIEAEELVTRLDDPALRIYDTTILFFSSDPNASSYEAYLKGHIPGAAVFDHLQFSDPDGKYDYTILPAAEIAAQIGRIGIAAESEVILYASSVLPSAARAWWILRYAGHEHMRMLNGGLDAWTKAGGTLEQEAHQYPPATFEGRFRPEMFASMEEVRTAMDDAAVLTEYALPLEMYGGAHIPGSVSHSCLNLITEDMNTLLSDEVILPQLKEGAGHERVITYCGGGIAAALNAMAHLIAGHENVALYDGSLLEWMGEGQPTARAEEA